MYVCNTHTVEQRIDRYPGAARAHHACHTYYNFRTNLCSVMGACAQRAGYYEVYTYSKYTYYVGVSMMCMYFMTT